MCLSLSSSASLSLSLFLSGKIEKERKERNQLEVKHHEDKEKSSRLSPQYWRASLQSTSGPLLSGSEQAEEERDLCDIYPLCMDLSKCQSTLLYQSH